MSSFRGKEFAIYLKRGVPLDLQQLQTFQMIAITGSFSRAAALLGYQQSSVTYQIKALEKALGAALIERERFSRKIALTEYGRRVLHYSGLILKLADDLLSRKDALRR